MLGGLHILDRLHIVAKMNKALDEVRASESRRMAIEGMAPVLRKPGWLLLKGEENLKTEPRSLRQHRELILNCFHAQKLLSSGVVEGLNNKAKVAMRRFYGFRTFRILELALYRSLGQLPEPESTHDFF
jgi:transposase